LLLYWVNLEKRILKDGFGLGTPTGSFIGPFSEGAYCHLYNLHGGLHLFDNGAGEILKAVDTGSGVISTITSTIAKKHRFPIYVAEGTSVQKMRKINSVAYLRHCYETLRHSSATIFVMVTARMKTTLISIVPFLRPKQSTYISVSTNQTTKI